MSTMTILYLILAIICGVFSFKEFSWYHAPKSLMRFLCCLSLVCMLLSLYNNIHQR